MKQSITTRQLLTAFGLNKAAVISIIGSGGKTTLMYRLAQELMQRNKKVITTTTTKIYPPTPEQSPKLILSSMVGAENFQPLLKIVNQYQHITLAARKNNEGKLIGIEPEIIDALADKSLTNGKIDYILVEADGARGKSLKGYRSDEPVIPKSSKICIVVVGWDILGKPLNERYVHRAKILSQMVNAKMNSKISTSTLIDALCLSDGYISRVPTKNKLIVFINKANYASDNKIITRFCQRLIKLSPRPINRIIIGSLQSNKNKPLRRKDNTLRTQRDSIS